MACKGTRVWHASTPPPISVHRVPKAHLLRKKFQSSAHHPTVPYYKLKLSDTRSPNAYSYSVKSVVRDNVYRPGPKGDQRGVLAPGADLFGSVIPILCIAPGNGPLPMGGGSGQLFEACIVIVIYTYIYVWVVRTLPGPQQLTRNSCDGGQVTLYLVSPRAVTSGAPPCSPRTTPRRAAKRKSRSKWLEYAGLDLAKLRY